MASAVLIGGPPTIEPTFAASTNVSPGPAGGRGPGRGRSPFNLPTGSLSSDSTTSLSVGITLPLRTSISLSILISTVPIPASESTFSTLMDDSGFTPIGAASSSSTQELNPTGIIIGATLGSISFIIVALFILLRWRRKKRRGKSSQKIDVVPYMKHNGMVPRKEKAFAKLARVPEHSRQQASERPRSRALSESDSILTARQQNIRSEADDLRRQLRTIQRTQETLVTSNDINDLKNTLAVMMAHIQRLDRQFESDWARGLTGEAPPDYVMVARG